MGRAIADALATRGPDDAGVWVDDAAGVALAHRRLSILDLSPAGHQPMVSPSGRYVIAYNGEIYNHLELRAELDKIGAGETAPFRWRGHADTETLLAAFDAWGIEATLKKAVGMFAFALWDRKTRTLTLARDRMGEKPLYYGWVKGALVFGSELKALRAFPGFDNPVERQALVLFMRYNSIPAPWSIYKDIWKLPPGCFVQFRLSDDGRPQVVSSHEGRCDGVKAYWSLRQIAQAGIDHPFEGSEEEATAELEYLLRQSLHGQMLADVPLGSFLFEDIDSSTVVALMQAMTESSQT